MEGLWRGCRGVVEGLWRGCGGVVEGLWWGCGGVVEGLSRGCGGVVEGLSRGCGACDKVWAFGPAPHMDPLQFSLQAALETSVLARVGLLLRVADRGLSNAGCKDPGPVETAIKKTGGSRTSTFF